MRLLVLIGLLAGFFSALLGVGGGLVIVPLLMLAARYAPREAMATSLAAIGITATFGTIGYAVLLGHVDVVRGALVGVPAAAGAVVGSGLQQRLTSRFVSLAFAGLLVGIAITLLIE